MSLGDLIPVLSDSESEASAFHGDDISRYIEYLKVQNDQEDPDTTTAPLYRLLPTPDGLHGAYNHDKTSSPHSEPFAEPRHARPGTNRASHESLEVDLDAAELLRSVLDWENLPVDSLANPNSAVGTNNNDAIPQVGRNSMFSQSAKFQGRNKSGMATIKRSAVSAPDFKPILHDDMDGAEILLHDREEQELLTLRTLAMDQSSEVTKRLTNIERETKHVQKDLVKLGSDLHQVRDETLAQRREEASQSVEIQRVHAMVKLLQDRQSHLEKELRETRSNLATEQEQRLLLENRVKHTESYYSSLGQAYQQLYQAHQQVQIDNGQMREDLDDLMEKYTNLNRYHDHLKKENSNLRREIKKIYEFVESSMENQEEEVDAFQPMEADENKENAPQQTTKNNQHFRTHSAHIQIAETEQQVPSVSSNRTNEPRSAKQRGVMTFSEAMQRPTNFMTHATSPPNLQATMREVKQLEHQLSQLSMERDQLDSEYRRIPLANRTMAHKQRQDFIERRLDEIEDRIGRTKMRLRSLGVM